jgi:hypothetical protein
LHYFSSSAPADLHKLLVLRRLRNFTYHSGRMVGGGLRLIKRENAKALALGRSE